jgi:hypothetical protein
MEKLSRILHDLDQGNTNVELAKQQVLDLFAVSSALLWWSKLSKSKQRDYEMQMFGYGEWWEDNSLHEDDIVKMFQHYA